MSKDNPDLIADQRIVEALIDRALALDPDFDSGAIHGFLITYETARQGAKGDPAARSRLHFDRAVALTKGQLASPFVSLAEAVSVQNQDRAEFESLLKARARRRSGRASGMAAAESHRAAPRPVAARSAKTILFAK